MLLTLGAIALVVVWRTGGIPFAAPYQFEKEYAELASLKFQANVLRKGMAETEALIAKVRNRHSVSATAPLHSAQSLAPTQDAPAVARARVFPRQTDIVDLGFSHEGKGWFDASCQGVDNDYCRFVGSVENMYFSCALAGTRDRYTPRGLFNVFDFDDKKRWKKCDRNYVSPKDQPLPLVGDRTMVAIGCPMTSKALHLVTEAESPLFKSALPSVIRTTRNSMDRYRVVVYAGYDATDFYWHNLHPVDQEQEGVFIRFIECNCSDMVCNTNCIMKRVG